MEQTLNNLILQLKPPVTFSRWVSLKLCYKCINQHGHFTFTPMLQTTSKHYQLTFSATEMDLPA